MSNYPLIRVVLTSSIKVTAHKLKVVGKIHKTWNFWTHEKCEKIWEENTSLTLTKNQVDW